MNFLGCHQKLLPELVLKLLTLLLPQLRLLWLWLQLQAAVLCLDEQVFYTLSCTPVVLYSDSSSTSVGTRDLLRAVSINTHNCLSEAFW